MLSERAFQAACARFHVKLANMGMIRRMMHFEDLARHANPQVKAVGGRLLENAARVVPKSFAPMGPLASHLPQHAPASLQRLVG